MKKLLILLFAVILSGVEGKAFSQTTKTIQTVTSNATVSATADVVVCTGSASITLTMPSSPATGRKLTIVNHTNQDVTLSTAVRVTSSKTRSLVSPYVSEFLSGISSNKITIIYDGTEWRLIG